MKERKCIECPAFYRCNEDNLSATAGGKKEMKIDGKDVLLCKPGPVADGKRTMQRFSLYCLAKPSGKKIGTIASWTGRTPVWCPLGRELEEHDGEW